MQINNDFWPTFSTYLFSWNLTFPSILQFNEFRNWLFSIFKFKYQFKIEFVELSNQIAIEMPPNRIETIRLE